MNTNNDPDATAPSTDSLRPSSVQAGQALRRRAEERLRERQSGHTPEAGGQRSAEETAQTLHELRVHQIELEMQNEELRRAQAEIEAGRARYFDLYDLAPVGYCTLSEQGLILEANLTAAALLGTARSALVKRPLSHFIIKDDQDVYYLNRKKLFETGKPQECDLRLVKPDGTNFWSHLTATTAQAEDGAPACRVALSDITERKQTESALRESGERFAQLAEQSRIVTWQVDASGLYTYVSHAVTSILGYTPEEIIGKMRFYDLHPETGRAAFKAAALEVFARKESFRDFENQAVTKAGGPVWFSTNGIPVLDENGNLAGYRGNDADITERKRADEALRVSEERFRTLTTLAPTGIYLTDPQGQCHYANPRWCEMAGMPLSSALGSGWVQGVHPEDRDDVLSTWARMLATEGHWGREYRFRTPEGKVSWVYGLATTVRDQEGKTTGYVGVNVDITKRKQAEEAHRETSLQLQESVRAANVGLWDWDLTTNRVHYSREWKRQIGYEDAEIDNAFEEWESRVHPEDLAPTMETIRAAITGTSRRYQAEFRFRHKDGSYRWIVAQCSVSRDETGKAVRVIGSHLDLTEYKQVEESLRESEARFRGYVEHAPYGVFVTDGQGRYVDVNPAATRITGYSAEQLTSMRISDLLAPESLETGLRHHRTLVETGESAGDMAFRRADGSLGHWMVSATRLGPDSYLSFVEDITERKEREERIAIMGRMLDAAPAAITIHNDEGQFLFSNRHNALLHGYESEEQFLGLRLHQLDVPVSEDLRAERLRRIAERGEARFEVAHYRKDGSTFPLEVTAKVIEWHGRPAVLSIGIDITERVRAEAEQDRLQAQFLRAQKMESVGRLAGGVAHDFNNLLMVIMNYAELCRDAVDPDHPTREWLDEITAESQRSANLVRQLLAFARKQPVQPKPVDMNEQVGGMLKLLRRMIGERIELTWSPAANLRTVSADPSHIDQVMANLCVNAADAIAGSGRIAIATRNVAMTVENCSVLPGLVPGAYVLLSVADTGCGMDADTVSHIFEPFFTTKGLGHGTGLGLATVYGIMKQSNGFIYVDSAPGAGTTFSIYLPAIECPETEAAPLANAGPPPGGSETILVVEDERSIRVTTAAHLERWGYTVLMADGPETALALAREHVGAIDLLLSDMVMPGMNGVELRERLLPGRPGLKTIFITGYTTPDFVNPEGKGPDTVRLMKPVPLRDLAIAIRSVLGDQRTEKT